MPKTITAINAELKGYAGDVPKVLGDLPKYSAKVKQIQAAYTASSQTLMKKAAEIDARAGKAKADLRKKYEADLKAIEDDEKAQHAANTKVLDSLGKSVIAAQKFDMTVIEIANIGRGCKLGAAACDALAKELKKADGDKDLKKATEALAAKTFKDYDGLTKSYAALLADGNKVLGAFR